MSIFLDVQNLSKHFIHNGQRFNILNNITVSFEQNSMYAITGVSGAGKSTLIQLLGGLDVPSEGSIYYGTTDINTCSPQEKEFFLNQSIGLVFQYPHLIRELTTTENVMIKGLIAGKKYNECEQKAKELLVLVGLSDHIDKKVGILSGGQQQRVSIARALFNEPVFLLADEPTGNLDGETGHAIIQLLIECKKRWGMGLIISSHDEYVIQHMDTVYELSSGNMLLIA